MLSEEIITEIDAKWRNCWPISSLKPFTVIDLISYIFFLKKVIEPDSIGEKIPEFSKASSFYDEDVTGCTWPQLKDMDAKYMHHLFTKQNGIIDLMSEYSNSDLPYNTYFKIPPAITPTPQLLHNSAAIVDIIGNSNSTTQAAIIKHLLNKSEVSDQNGQADIPEYMARLLVGIMQPTAKDIVWDPIAGNAMLLVNTFKYISSRNPLPADDFKVPNPFNIQGTETSWIQLRIGSMNMMLNGITDSALTISDIFPGANVALLNKPSLIISNLFFTGIESKMSVDEKKLVTENTRKEITFLNLILKNLQPGARAAFIVADAMLYSNQLPIKTIREEIVENCNLEAVIALPVKKEFLFSGGAMLIMRKDAMATSKVWFHKLQMPAEANDEKYMNPANNGFSSGEQHIVDTILNHLGNKEVPVDKDTDNSFYVATEQLRNNSYNFNYNQYGLILKKPIVPIQNKITTPVEAKNLFTDTDTEHDKYFAKELPVEKKSRTKKIVALIILLGVIITGFAYYVLNFKNEHTLADTIAPGNKVISDDDTSVTPKTLVKKMIENDTAKRKSARVHVVDTAKPVQNITFATDDLAIDTSDLKNERYSVISKAYFYSEPNEKSIEKRYLTHWNNGDLIPTKEQDDFVYVTFDNHNGRILKGWLNKKDLLLVSR